MKVHHYDQNDDLADLIAHTPDDLAGLIAELETLRRAARRIFAVTDERDELRAQVERVRELHRPVDVEPSETVCAGCSTARGNGATLRYFPYAEYPCPTIRALEGDNDAE